MSFLYYFPIVNLFNLGIYFLLEYLTDDTMFIDNMKTTALNVGLWGVEKYTVLKDIYNKHVYPYVKKVYAPNEGNIVYYNKTTRESDVVERLPINVLENRDSYLIFYNDRQVNDNIEQNKFIQIHDDDDIREKLDSLAEFSTSAPFIQVEFHDESNVIDITQDVKDYCVDGNVLDSAFFRYILDSNHKFKITNDTYTIKIMDATISMKTVESSQVITIKSNNTYELE